MFRAEIWLGLRDNLVPWLPSFFPPSRFDIEKKNICKNKLLRHFEILLNQNTLDSKSPVQAPILGSVLEIFANVRPQLKDMTRASKQARAHAVRGDYVIPA